MISKKILITTALLGTALTLGGAIFATNNFGLNILKTSAVDVEKVFTFDKDNATQVYYSAGDPPRVSNVETGFSSPIATKFYRESGTLGDKWSRSGYFFTSNYAGTRTYAFEAGLNNLTGFGIEFSYSYDSQYDDPSCHFSYDVTLTFYNGNTVVDTKVYTLDDTDRGVTYTHTWVKDNEITDKIDRVKCSLYSYGSSYDTYRVLRIHHFIVNWTC